MWILILVLIGWDGISGVTIEGFKTRENCIKSGKQVAGDTSNGKNTQTKYSCIYKE